MIEPSVHGEEKDKALGFEKAAIGKSPDEGVRSELSYGVVKDFVTLCAGFSAGGIVHITEERGRLAVHRVLMASRSRKKCVINAVAKDDRYRWHFLQRGRQMECTVVVLSTR
jgi:hypothetical protein